MVFKNFRVNLIIRVVALTLTILLLGQQLYDESFFLTQLLTFGLIVLQVYSIIRFVDTTNREIAGFLESIRYDDFSHTYPVKRDGSSLDMLKQEFNKVMRKFREIRAEKEAQYHYLKTIVQHVGIGIITFDKQGNVQIINAAAKRLLRIHQLNNVNQLRSISEPLVTSFKELKTGGRDLVKLDLQDSMVQLSIYAIELTLRGDEFKLVSLNNISSELEEKEMEAWQNLIRVLTHEIMNSVTPISSLAATVEDDLNEQLNNNLEINQISNDDIEDLHMAVKTIHRRSESLIRFVNDFRNLTRIPTPQFDHFPVQDLFYEIITLHKIDLEKEGIQLNCEVRPDTLELYADRALIEQVLINLIKNAIQALASDDSTTTEPRIDFTARVNEHSKVEIIVRDNGPGIEEEALQKIFIPFFTTKKSGSGIGLSLSKQIIRKHAGTISVKSVINAGTEFAIKL